MKKVLLALGLLGLMLSLIGCLAEPQSTLEQAKVKKGKELFAKNCLPCHGEKAQGKIGPSLISPKIKEDLEKNEEGGLVEETILKGRKAMPSFEDKISHKEVHELRSYLLSLQQWNK